MKKLGILFASTLFLTVMTPTAYAESPETNEGSRIEDIEIADKENSINGVAVYATRERMYTSNNDIPSSLYVTEIYNGYIYRGTIYLDRVQRLSNGNYMAYYSGNIPRTPIMASNIEFE